MVTRRALIPFHFGHRLDIIPNRSGDNWMVSTYDRLADRLRGISDARPQLVVSGDCMAAISAHRDGLDLVWMDAHGDFNTLETTETCNIGGMPLAMMMGLGDQALMKYCGKRSLHDIDWVHHIGGSVFDEDELERMCDYGIDPQLARELGGDSPNFYETIHPIHLHIDTDVIRESEMPSAFHPAPRGLPLDVFYKQLDLLLPYTEVLSIKSYDPRKDGAGIGEGIVLEIIRRFEAC